MVSKDADVKSSSEADPERVHLTEVDDAEGVHLTEVDDAEGVHLTEVDDAPTPASSAPSSHKTIQKDMTNLLKTLSWEEAMETLRNEPLQNRIWRKVSEVAGVRGPLNEDDYRKYEKLYGKSGLQQTVNTYPDKVMIGTVLHATVPPFDVYGLIKASDFKFICIVTILYFVLISLFFSIFGLLADCYPVKVTPGNILPLGFRVISGMGNIESFSTECLVIDSVAVLLGVYTSLPVFGAVVLVRLLDHSTKSISVGSNILLTMRDGKPTVMLRAMNEIGHFLHNFEAQITFIQKNRDEYTDEGMMKFIPF